MGKAIVGTYGDPRTISLLGEVRALRARIAELEKALEAAERALKVRGSAQVVDLDREASDSEARSLDPAGSVIA